ncbi:FAD-binding protein [Phytohabitans sp. ZYX-F-186]|uniref:FAD-binding protein n=1 Tax=Phytohabitans maris TaxID=3071409 RepID=A0ABU0ZEV0_9ACTN|nr:FAD-binding protein [Phytohabitans sp. ZYX-F-186]MDQ7905563.1 FAD-binding protein [Phytohabitans sp. ZYX-F-186]
MTGDLVDVGPDVAVAGGGACGVMAALRAAQNPDLVVAVFEKSTREGCNAAISSGSLAAGGTRFQRAAGIDDSPLKHAEEILAASGDKEWRPVVEAVCAVAPAMVEWLADTGYPIEIGTDMPRAGMSVPRLHTDSGRQGGGRLMRHLRGLLGSYPNVAFVDEAPVVDLVVDAGAVSGVVVDQNGRRQRIGAGTVVLAVDGFAGNPALVKEHLSDLGNPYHGGVSTSTGDALDWVRRLGGRVRNMGAGLRSGLVVVDHGTRVSPALPFHGAVLVAARGRRFVDEQRYGYSALAQILRRQPGERAAMIFDATALAATRESEMMRQCLAAGAIREVATLDGLAAQLGLDVERVREAVRARPGRRQLRPPFQLAWVTHGLLATQGGVVIDTQGRVLDSADRPIPHLYAGGGTACGLAGPSSDGYLSGNGLLSAFGMGWIIGNALASRPTGRSAL